MTVEYLLAKLEEACILKGRSVRGTEINKMPGFPCKSQYEKCGGICRALQTIGRTPLLPPQYLNKKLPEEKMRDVLLKMRFAIFARDNFTCQYCGSTPKEGAKLCVDHIVPFSKGGETIFANLTTSCFFCNIGKRDVILDSLLNKKNSSQ